MKWQLNMLDWLARILRGITAMIKRNSAYILRNLKNFITIYPIVSWTIVIFLSVSLNRVNILMIVTLLRYRLTSLLLKGTKVSNATTATPKLMTLLLLFLRKLSGWKYIPSIRQPRITYIIYTQKHTYWNAFKSDVLSTLSPLLLHTIVRQWIKIVMLTR